MGGIIFSDKFTGAPVQAIEWHKSVLLLLLRTPPLTSPQLHRLEPLLPESVRPRRRERGALLRAHLRPHRVRLQRAQRRARPGLRVLRRRQPGLPRRVCRGWRHAHVHAARGVTRPDHDHRVHRARARVEQLPDVLERRDLHRAPVRRRCRLRDEREW